MTAGERCARGRAPRAGADGLEIDARSPDSGPRLMMFRSLRSKCSTSVVATRSERPKARSFDTIRRSSICRLVLARPERFRARLDAVKNSTAEQCTQATSRPKASGAFRTRSGSTTPRICGNLGEDEAPAVCVREQDLRRAPGGGNSTLDSIAGRPVATAVSRRAPHAHHDSRQRLPSGAVRRRLPRCCRAPRRSRRLWRLAQSPATRAPPQARASRPRCRCAAAAGRTKASSHCVQSIIAARGPRRAVPIRERCALCVRALHKAASRA